jgi:4-amino-4-deoxy-L-arabinose transferase-like glycosyltransferase
MRATTPAPKAVLSARAFSGWGSRPALGWLLLALALLLWFGTLDARHLLRSDEGRYAEIAREMAASGDWVTIRYQGLKYFEKPPLHLWMTALTFEAFGVGEWQARLWVALSGALGIGGVALAAQRWFGGGALAALVLLACPTWIIGSHFNSLDMGVSAALGLTLCAVLLAQHPQASPGQRRVWMLAAWAAMGAAVLSKGLIGLVLPGLSLVVYTLLARHWTLWRQLHLVAGTAVFLLVTVPWFWLVQQRNPEFAPFFFIHEHFQRYTSTVHQRSAPAWYFVPQLLAGYAPWLGLLPAMWGTLRTELQAGAEQQLRPLLLCAVFAGVTFAFFSASGSKLPGYILPVFPALAVWGAASLQALSPTQWSVRMGVMGGLALLLLAASFLIGRAGAGDAALRSYGLWVSAACALFVAAAAGAWTLSRRGRPMASIATWSLGVLLAVTVGLLGHETLGRPASGADLVPAIDRVLKPGMPIYAVRLLDHTLPFYLRRTTVMVEEADELDFGTRQEPDKWLPTLAAFEKAWAGGPPALALMTPDTYSELQSRTHPLVMNLVARDGRRVVVANFPVAPPAPAAPPAPPGSP